MALSLGNKVGGEIADIWGLKHVKQIDIHLITNSIPTITFTVFPEEHQLKGIVDIIKRYALTELDDDGEVREIRPRFKCGKCGSHALNSERTDLTQDDYSQSLYIVCQMCGNRYPGGLMPVEDKGAEVEEEVPPHKNRKEKEGIAREAFKTIYADKLGVNTDFLCKEESLESFLEERMKDDGEEDDPTPLVETSDKLDRQRAKGGGRKKGNYYKPEVRVKVAELLREGKDGVNIIASAGVSYTMIRSVYNELAAKGEKLFCKCGKEILHRGLCNHWLAQRVKKFEEPVVQDGNY